MTDLVPLPLPGLDVGSVGARPTDLAVLDPDATCAAIAHLRDVDSTSWWIVGDLVLALAHRVGDAEANRRLAAVGHDPAHLGRCMAVAFAVPHRLRRPELTWTHHQVVSRLTHDDQQRWLGRAVEEGWSTRDLRRAIAAEEAEQNPPIPGLGPLPRPPESLLRRALDEVGPDGLVVWQPGGGSLAGAHVHQVDTQRVPGSVIVVIEVPVAMAPAIHVDQHKGAA